MEIKPYSETINTNIGMENYIITRKPNQNPKETVNSFVRMNSQFYKKKMAKHG